MKNQIQKLFLADANKRKQVILVSVILFALGVMSFSMIDRAQALTTGNSNGTQSVVSGSLSLDSAPDSLPFNNNTPGQNLTTNTTTNGVVTNDTTGSGLGWHVIGFWQTNWLKNTDSNIQSTIKNRMAWFPQSATITNVTGVAGGAIAGANANFTNINSENNAGLTLMFSNNNTSSNNGAGAFNMTNLKFNYNIPATSVIGNYTSVLNLTITSG
jgi:hypothetical protein